MAMLLQARNFTRILSSSFSSSSGTAALRGVGCVAGILPSHPTLEILLNKNWHQKSGQRSLSATSTTSTTSTNSNKEEASANIVLIGAGWWSQGWHLPHLDRNEKVNIAAIVDSSPHPKSNLNPHLEPLTTLAKRYPTKNKTDCPIFHSVEELLAHPIGQSMDGAIVCTPHSTHYEIGKQLIEEGERRYENYLEYKKEIDLAKLGEAADSTNATDDGEDTNTNNKKGYRPMNILMEKPMTTNVDQAKKLHDLLIHRRKEHAIGSGGEHSELDNGKDVIANGGAIGGGINSFLINHSANYRPQARAARSLIQSGKLGQIRHVSAFFASPLSWIFDDPSNTGWNEPDDGCEHFEGMLGNGFAWGQSSHLLAWIYHVTGGGGTEGSHGAVGEGPWNEALIPSRVYCAMTHSPQTNADVSHAATIQCTNGATFSLSGTSLLPGNAHSDPPVGKRVKIQIFGTKGALVYWGNDRDVESGRLEWLRGEDKDGENGNVGAVEIQCPDLGFQFEDLDQEGIGPESLQCFIDACLGRDDYYVGADSLVGLRSVQTIDAMYRSNVSGNCENVRHIH